jgi:hypothetical protein
VRAAAPKAAQGSSSIKRISNHTPKANYKQGSDLSRYASSSAAHATHVVSIRVQFRQWVVTPSNTLPAIGTTWYFQVCTTHPWHPLKMDFPQTFQASHMHNCALREDNSEIPIGGVIQRPWASPYFLPESAQRGGSASRADPIRERWDDQYRHPPNKPQPSRTGNLTPTEAR